MAWRTPRWWNEDGAVAKALMPLACLYAVGAGLRARMTKGWAAPVPVICVGNLTAGGAGKTPTAMAVAERLKARGRRPHFLTRGYGGTARGPLRVDPAHHEAAEVGDEALLLARHAPCWVARDRVAGAKAAVAAGADCLVLDDGLQNPALVKTLSLAAIDAGFGFGNGRLMPAGPLREPIASGLAKVAAAVMIGEGGPAVSVPVLRARLVPTDPAPLRGKRVLAFAGIGRPEKFADSLRQLGAVVVGLEAFADHHPFMEVEIERLERGAREADAILVTTAKDRVRLPAERRDKIAVLEVALRFEDPAALDALLDRAVGTKA
ncbi:MAG: tetraacyldisaccharide 4'-kinase [Alphaproteobacteria bacterium]|nr:tetraacyldisaccharide 4'-kinase [Alphaproteobacteria bacterium]